MIPFKSVVKVFVVTAKPNCLLPWQMGRQESCTGSAFHIAGERLLTNAHVVRDYTTVRVRRHGGAEKYKAKVLCINHACDLAILAVDDAAFWKGMTPLSISKKIPELYENAMVIGYPLGGDNICVTRGVVSRVTTLPYEDPKFFLPSQELIAIQLDAAINSGNSGGPALDESGSIIGVAFSGYAGSADNIGYIIPHPVIYNFLKQFEASAEVSRVCDLGIGYMLCENPSLRERHKIVAPASGVLVTKVAPLSAAAKAGIQKDDVLMRIDACNIQNDGTIDFREDERLSFQHKVSSRVIGESLHFEILRSGKLLQLDVPGVPTPELVPRHRQVGTSPSYLIVGGVVFTKMTCGLLDVAVEVLSEGAWQRGREPKKDADEEVIVVISVLGHPVNHGYEIHRLPLLKEFNGKPVLNMRELRRKVMAVKEGFLHFLLGEGKSIIFDAKACRDSEDEIFKTYAIPAPCSPDLLEGSAAAAAPAPRKSAKRGSFVAKGKAKAKANGKAASKTTSSKSPSSKPTKRPADSKNAKGKAAAEKGMRSSKRTRLSAKASL
mmetsp:Transcript_9357/g.24081  ORF Transcript_9357/g.24081 Transcript_9357/m.24081 type:complete len:550 (+) Transcript_9357:106-1755(+)